jgi:pimeloyl-ACP methyl ester carboxylesterase
VVLAQIGIALDEAVDWVGNAWGGHVGILFAAVNPNRCRSLVTIGTPVHALPPAE